MIIYLFIFRGKGIKYFLYLGSVCPYVQTDNSLSQFRHVSIVPLILNLHGDLYNNYTQFIKVEISTYISIVDQENTFFIRMIIPFVSHRGGWILHAFLIWKQKVCFFSHFRDIRDKTIYNKTDTCPRNSFYRLKCVCNLPKLIKCQKFLNFGYQFRV